MSRDNSSQEQYLNPFDDEQQVFKVLVNARQQYSLWPLFAVDPNGWALAFGPAPHAECLDYVERNWTSINPFKASLSACRDQ